jgi:glucuronoarabinoxylan endo-1,4-beta-xylanase
LLLAAGVFAAPAALAQVTVQPEQVRQRMDGFGASSAFFSENISDEDAEFLFSVETGIGLSMLRVRINHQDNDTTDIETAKKAKMWGASVWAAPWTPPPEWKTNMDLNAQPMAHLRSQNYPDFANYLADFAEWMEAQGVPLLAITPQNEPDWEASWDGCLWSASEMATFIGKHLGPVFEQRGLDVMIVAPDTAHLKNLPAFATALLADADAKKYLAGISTHPYESSGFDPDWSVPRDNGLFFWQTEISQENFNPRDNPDPSMTSALSMVRMMHDHLTRLWMGAWNWWNLTAVTENYEDDPNRQNPALIQNGMKFKRAYVMGNFSKFVRPGFFRIEATPSPATDILVSAYKSNDRLVIVAVNASSSASSQTFTIQGALPGPVAQAVPWVTSDSLSLEAQTPIAVANGAFQAMLPMKSVTSFVLDMDVPDMGAGGMGGTGGMGGMVGTAGGAGDTTGLGGMAGAAAGLGGMVAVGGDAAAGMPATAGAGAAVATGGAGGDATGGVPTAGSGTTSAGAGGVGVGGAGGAAPTTGGTGPMTTGGTTGAGPGTSSAAPAEAAGCGCRMVGTSADASRWALSLLVLGFALARRRGRAARA